MPDLAPFFSAFVPAGISDDSVGRCRLPLLHSGALQPQRVIYKSENCLARIWVGVRMNLSVILTRFAN